MAARISPRNRPRGQSRQHLRCVLNRVLEEEIACSTAVRRSLRNLIDSNVQSLDGLFKEHSRQLDCLLGEILERTREAGVIVGVGRSAPAGPELVAGAQPGCDLIGELLLLHERVAERLSDDEVTSRVDSSTGALLKRLLEFHVGAIGMLRMVRENGDVPVSAR